MRTSLILMLLACSLLPAVTVSTARAHCDTMDGPTVADGLAALSSGDLTPALKWVTQDVETELTAVFEHVKAVRGSSELSRQLADKYFLETLVRLHRAGEGAPYTGLKPVGTEIEPVVKLADESLAGENVEELIGEITREVSEGIRVRYDAAIKANAHKEHNVEAGRTFVAAYVSFVHYVEKIATVAASQTEHGEGASEHQH